MAPRKRLTAITGVLFLGLIGTTSSAQPLPGVGSKAVDSDRPKEASQGVRVIELAEGSVTSEPVRFFPGHTARVGSIVFFPGGDRLLSVSNDGSLRVWEIATGKPLRQFKIEKGRGEVALSPDGRLVATTADRTVALLDLKEDGTTPGRGRELERADNGFIGELVFSPDGRQLASANYDGSAIVWDVKTGRLAQRFQGHRDQVRSVAFHPSGDRVVTGSYDKTVRIWDLNSGKQIRALSGHEKPVLTVAVSPGGDHVASGGFDRVARLWDFATGREIRSFSGHTDAINSVAFSPDGRKLLTASSDHSVRLWDVATGEELHRFIGHTDYVLDAVFSPDGRSIASSSGGDIKDGRWVPGEDYAIRLWRVPADGSRGGQ